jgi:hypothetical protein
LLGQAVMCWRVRRRAGEQREPASPRQRYGLHTLKAATTHDNIAPQEVLAKHGFVAIGPAELSPQARHLYERDLSAG